MAFGWHRRTLWLRQNVVLAVAVLAVALLLGAGLFWRQALIGRGQAQADQRIEIVEPQPFASTINLVGAITAADRVDVTAPFDGVVRSVGFEYGGAVNQGQVLLQLDTTDIEQRRGEAAAEFLRTSQAAADMAAWTTGQEMSQARRAASQAALDLSDTEHKVQETKALLDRGLVPRGEFDALVQQQRSQEIALTAARQDLETTLKRGQGSNRRIAGIELANARARLSELDVQMAGAVVRAPVAGVIVRPSGEKTDAAGQMHAGASMAHGQLIGVIAPAGGLAVAFELGEADANLVRPGQHVTVSGPGFGAFTLHGVVASVAREASPASAGGESSASFAALARLDPLRPAEADAVRVGMTATVAVDVYRSASALVVPPASIIGAAPDAAVLVRDPRTRRPRRVAVQIGHVAPDGVEVLSGLRAGDVVLWSAAKAAASHADDDS
jgi:HlyD family secretion protein